MRIFVTGASGFIGSAVVRELIGAGHQVVGLARSDGSADSLTNSGAQVHRGDLADLDSLRAGAAASDGVIHLAFIMNFFKYDESARIDLGAIEALSAAIEGSDRPLIIASGTIGLPPGRVGTERDEPDPDHPLHARAAGEQAALAAAARGVRSASLRLPPIVHGKGKKGFVGALIDIARDKGVSGYVGGGTSRWPAVNVLDVAHLFRLAVEKAPAGSVLHGVAEEGVSTRAIAEVIGQHLDLPVLAVSPEDANGHFGWLAALLASDVPASGTSTQQLLGWRPTHPGLLETLHQGHFFGPR
jgi:nucleoside-diphosphate-sugar epimerase